MGQSAEGAAVQYLVACTSWICPCEQEPDRFIRAQILGLGSDDVFLPSPLGGSADVPSCVCVCVCVCACVCALYTTAHREQRKEQVIGQLL